MFLRGVIAAAATLLASCLSEKHWPSHEEHTDIEPDAEPDAGTVQESRCEGMVQMTMDDLRGVRNQIYNGHKKGCDQKAEDAHMLYDGRLDDNERPIVVNCYEEVCLSSGPFIYTNDRCYFSTGFKYGLFDPEVRRLAAADLGHPMGDFSFAESGDILAINVDTGSRFAETLLSGICIWKAE